MSFEEKNTLDGTDSSENRPTDPQDEQENMSAPEQAYDTGPGGYEYAYPEGNPYSYEEGDNSAPEEIAQKPPQSEEDFELASDVEEYLRDVIDPELGINVVDLGLVYDIWIEDGTKAVVNMTLTSPACPLTDMIEEQAASAVLTHDLVEKLTINWVWMPPWGPHMITEEGREQLRALGFSV